MNHAVASQSQRNYTGHRVDCVHACLQYLENTKKILQYNSSIQERGYAFRDTDNYGSRLQSRANHTSRCASERSSHRHLYCRLILIATNAVFYRCFTDRLHFKPRCHRYFPLTYLRACSQQPKGRTTFFLNLISLNKCYKIKKVIKQLRYMYWV